jgi:hypothetical protein
MNAAHAKEFDAVTKDAALDLRGRGGGHPSSQRGGPRSGRSSLTLCRRHSHMPVRARGSRRPVQLSPPRSHSGDIEVQGEGPEARASLTCKASLDPRRPPVNQGARARRIAAQRAAPAGSAAGRSPR